MQTLQGSEGQGNLTCCSPWGCRVGHYLVTEQQHGALVSFDLEHFLSLVFFWFFWLLWSKITADGDCSHEIKRHLTPWKESYDQPR